MAPAAHNHNWIVSLNETSEPEEHFLLRAFLEGAQCVIPSTQNSREDGIYNCFYCVELVPGRSCSLFKVLLTRS